MKRFGLLILCLAAFAWRVAAEPVESSLSHRRFTTADGLPQMQTETVWQDSRGYIYIGTLSGFVRFDGIGLTPFLSGRRENIVQFVEVEGQVRALGFVRQWQVRGNEAEMTQIDPEGQLLLNNLNAADLPRDYILLEDRQEQNRRLCRLGTGGMETVLESPILDEMPPDRKLFVDSTSVYIPTPQGLYRTEGGQARRLTRKADVFSLARTPGRLYAFAADGIYQVREDSLALLCAHCFEDPDYGLSVRQDRKGRLFIADAHTLWLYDGASSLRQLASGFNMIRGLFVDKWDRLWAATYQGAYCFFHCNFTNYRLEDRNDIVRAVGACDGHLVLGTLNGKVLMDEEVISNVEGNFYAPGAVTIGQEVYLVGNGDVAAVRDDAFRWLGLPADRYRFVGRAGDRLIIGASRSVLSYDPASARLDTLTQEIVRPWCAVEDGEGRLWVSGNPGLYCLTGWKAGGSIVKKVVSTPATPVISAMATDGNRVCYAFGDALFMIRGDEPVKMEEVAPALSGHEIRALHLSPKGYLMAAAIDGLLVARMDAEGHAGDIHWFDAGSGFTNIEPLMGTMAEDDDGTVWLAGLEEMTSFRPWDLLSDNQEPTVVEMPRPWWKRWWAVLATVLLLMLAIWMAARRVERRLAGRKMERLEHEKRQKELQLSAVRLKAIPHFHANVLSGIEYFVMNKSADEATRYLKLYSDFTNQTLSDIDKPSRTVAEEVDYVRTYLELEQLRYGERLNFSIWVDPGVDRNVMLPTMLLHTYCQNAVKHGIASKAGAGNVEVRIVPQRRDGADGVSVSVRDDGVGREEAARSGGYSTKQGLKILQEQIELYNRANRHPIVQEVTDLTDSEGRPAGTCFATWVPVDYQY